MDKYHFDLMTLGQLVIDHWTTMGQCLICETNDFLPHKDYCRVGELATKYIELQVARIEQEINNV